MTFLSFLRTFLCTSRSKRLSPCLFLALVLGSCDCNPPATVDAAASSLDVTIGVLDTTQNSSDGKVPVVVQFLLNGALVQFGSNAQVTCNGVTLAFNGLGNAGRVPMVPPGGTYTVSYIHGGTTTAAVVAPARPVITSPAANSTVTRTNNLTISYVADGGVGVRPSAGDGSTGMSGSQQPDNGTATGLNVTSLHPGAGSVGLVREIKGPIGGTGFKSATSDYSVGIDEKVTWN